MSILGIPIVSGLFFWVLFHLLAKIHIAVFGIFMFTYGIWFSILLREVIKYFRRNEITDLQSVLFWFFGALHYFLTFAYLAKNYDSFLFLRSITYLPFNGFGYLLFGWLLFRIRIKVYDYLLVFIYGTGLNYLFTDKSTLVFTRLDFMIAIWITLFTLHVILICKRAERTPIRS